jgi:hypothetical protein
MNANFFLLILLLVFIYAESFKHTSCHHGHILKTRLHLKEGSKDDSKKRIISPDDIYSLTMWIKGLTKFKITTTRMMST